MGDARGTRGIAVRPSAAGASLVVLLATIAVAGCQDSPTSPSRDRCRLYPTRMQVVGTEAVYTCAIESGPSLTCRAGIFGPTRAWHYASDADFVDEAAQPAHQLRRTLFEARSGTLVGASSRQTIVWAYDALRRPTRQEEVIDVLGGALTSVAIFTAWDEWGRPTQAEVTDGGQARSVAIVYADRTMRWSDGRSVVVDANGHVVAEPPPGGGEPTRWSILTTAEYCTP